MRETDELLELEATYEPGSDAPPKHYHPAQDEHFEVLEESLRTVVEGRGRDLGPGDALDVGRGEVHQMWNAGSETARVKWQVRPAGRTRQWFEDIDSLHREGRVGKNGMPGPLAFGVLLTEYRDVFRLALPAEPMVRGALAGLALAGRARGYSAGASR